MRSTHGLLSAAHFPLDYDSSSERDHLGGRRTKAGCLLLFSLPPGHNMQVNLRKLRLVGAKQKQCLEADGVLQFGTVERTVHTDRSSWYDELIDVQGANNKLKIERSFCGKVHDYSKSERSWRTSSAHVFMRLQNRPGARYYLAPKSLSLTFRIFGVCSDLLFTDSQAVVNVNELDDKECTFRVHIPYGYKIRLSLELMLKPAAMDAIDYDSAPFTWHASDNNPPSSLLLESGTCPLLIEIDDSAGKQISDCLSIQHKRTRATFLSHSNVLRLQATFLTSSGIRAHQLLLLLLLYNSFYYYPYIYYVMSVCRKGISNIKIEYLFTQVFNKTFLLTLTSDEMFPKVFLFS